MTDPQQIIESYQYLFSDLIRVAFGYIGVTIAFLAFLALYKKHQRELLWIFGIVMLLIVLALIVFGVLNLNIQRDTLVVFLGVICPGLYVYYAEKLHKKQKGNVKVIDNTSSIDDTVKQKSMPSVLIEQKTDETIENITEDVVTEEVDTNHVILPPRLATDLAKKVYEKARVGGYITEEDRHYAWHGTKALLAYMCGRIYCEDKSEFDKTTRVNIWKQGKLTFPETALNNLFYQTNLGQSRRSRELSPCPDGFRTIDSYFC